MRLTYLEEAGEELAGAVRYYKALGGDLGAAFFREVETAEREILSHPAAWRGLGGPYRRRRLRRYPYGLAYHQPEPGWLEIVAVMHLHREPDYWRARVEP